MDEALSHRVGPDFRLADVDPTSTPGFEWKKEDWEREFHEHDDELGELQEMLYANGRSGVPGTGAVLLILQGMDTAGKGGVIRHVFRAFDPQTLKIKAFGAPTAEERMHDFLWRVRPHEPAVGQIGVFDRSHYEDVLIVSSSACGRWPRRRRSSGVTTPSSTSSARWPAATSASSR